MADVDSIWYSGWPVGPKIGRTTNSIANKSVSSVVVIGSAFQGTRRHDRPAAGRALVLAVELADDQRYLGM